MKVRLLPIGAYLDWTAHLRQANAAQNSMYLPDRQGVFRATDFRTASIPAYYLSQVAARLKQCGVGFYTRDFLHLDTGELIGKSGCQRI